MKKALVVLLAALLCFNIGPFNFAVSEGEFFTKTTADYFSTVSVLKLSGLSRERFSELWENTKKILEDIEKSASLSMPGSDISRFNQLSSGEEIAVSSYTADMLSAAFYAYEKTGGLYNPCVYPLVDLWGFSYRFNASSYKKEMPYDRDYVSGSLPPPKEKYINAFLDLLDFSKIELTKKDGVYYLKKNMPCVFVDGVKYNAMLDLGGIAKGYACDKVIEMLKEASCSYGLFICGQSSLGFLKNTSQDNNYLLELKKPFGIENSKAYYANTYIKDAMLSSSVPYSKGYSAEGVSYYHIINPNTGFPLSDSKNNALCSTAIASNAALCDALTTGICLMDRESFISFLQSNPNIKALAVYESPANKNYEVISNLDESLINMLSDEYVLKILVPKSLKRTVSTKSV
ncbi:MAG: FAD:protein FMN transferase [Christensenellales bacterium]|jgi:thiamine biosynthesis lipoprotein